MEKSFPSISIIGMAGCGKTEIGKRLASIFDFDFFDTDQIIEEHFNKSLQSILEEVGYFEAAVRCLTQQVFDLSH